MRTLDSSFDSGSGRFHGQLVLSGGGVRLASVEPYVSIRPASGNVVM
jgi:hypothetical protein